MHSPSESSTPEGELRVVVERSGGVAGMTRRWSVAAPPEPASSWRPLVEACPWSVNHDASFPPQGADRFCWTVTVDCDGESRVVTLPDEEITGPWLALIAAVRNAGATDHRSRRGSAPASEQGSAPEQ